MKIDIETNINKEEYGLGRSEDLTQKEKGVRSRQIWRTDPKKKSMAQEKKKWREKKCKVNIEKLN